MRLFARAQHGTIHRAINEWALKEQILCDRGRGVVRRVVCPRSDGEKRHDHKKQERK